MTRGATGGGAVKYDTTEWDMRSSHGLVVHLVGTQKDVLDVGCATGGLLGHLVGLGNRGVGLEGDPAQARVAASKGLEVLEWDLERGLPPLEGRSFDAVVFADVLEHLKDPAPVLRQARARLAPGGRVIVSVPNIAHCSTRGRLLIGRFEYGEYGIMDRTHLRFFTKASVTRLLEECGFRVDRVVPVPAVPAPPGLERLALGRAWVRSATWRKLEDFAADLLPGLFAYQFVVEARPQAPGLSAAPH